MKRIAGFVAAAVATGCVASAYAADFKTLRFLKAGAPTSVAALPTGTKTRPVEFSRIVVHPADGEPWAIAYESSDFSDEKLAKDYKLLSWDAGATEAERTSFAGVFDDEVRKAGFASQSTGSVFDDGNGTDLKVGVLIDDLKGRFCLDCPHMFNQAGVPGTAVMSAHWEIYSSLDRKVIARITTSGGAEYKTRITDSFLPVIFEGFRENVRQLLASDDFRRVVMNSPGAQPTGAAPGFTALTPIAFAAPRASVSVAQAAMSVAIIYAADGQGSGFLVSADGHVLTNQHVVGGSKYVKLKWSNGAETLGEVIRADRRRDVALIKTDPQGRSPLSLRSGTVQQGETVFAIGTPLDDSLQNTMTKGIVSAERMEKGLRFIQSDAGINHGNSGGPLLDDKGAVVAIAVSGLLPDSHQMGLNFFIPIDDALKALALTPVAATATPTKSAPASAAKAVRPKG